jgi:hypothetical protein
LPSFSAHRSALFAAAGLAFDLTGQPANLGGGLIRETARYFEEQVLRKRPYIRREWCEAALRHPARREAQPDGRVRYWLFVPELGKHLRVVTLAAGETVLNAFPDRDYKEQTI